MTTKSRGPLAGFGWLNRGITMTFRHPKLLLGGTAFLLLASLLPVLVTLPLQFAGLRDGTPPDPARFGLIMLCASLLALLMVPILAGFMRVLDAAERGVPARARDVFAPYRQGEGLRFIGFGLVLKLIYFAIFGGVLATTGRGVVRWYMQVLGAQVAHQPPPTVLPEGFGITVALCALVALLMMGVYAISFGQFALRNRSVSGAIGDGFSGALKNLLPLLMFFVGIVLAWIVACLGVGILVAVLMLLAKLAGVWLMLVLLVPLYIVFVLCLMAVMYSVMYQLWRDVCDGDTAPSAPVMQSVAA